MSYSGRFVDKFESMVAEYVGSKYSVATNSGTSALHMALKMMVQGIRNMHLTRKEAVLLVNKYDGEFLSRYFNDVMDYLEIDPEEFAELSEKFRSPHLWLRTQTGWDLRNKLK